MHKNSVKEILFQNIGSISKTEQKCDKASPSPLEKKWRKIPRAKHFIVLVLVLVCTTHFLMELIIFSCSGKRAAAQNFFYICGQGCICLVFWFWRHLVPKLDFLPLERAGWLCFTGKGHTEINPKTIRHSLCGHHFC